MRLITGLPGTCTLFFPLPRRWRKDSPASTEVALKLLFGQAPTPSRDSATKAVWITRHVEPRRKQIALSFPLAVAQRPNSERVKAVRITPTRGRDRTIMAWALADGSPPDGFAIASPVFVPVASDTTRREIFAAWQTCRRVLRPIVSTRGAALGRGLEYWFRRYGIADMPAAWLQKWGHLKDVSPLALDLILADYLRAKNKPPRRTLVS